MTLDSASDETLASTARAASEGSAASGDAVISGGLMTWAAAISGPLAGCTCLWQDLDGLHVEPAPEQTPPTSILWGWRGDSYLVRTRLNGNDAYVAVLDMTAAGLAGHPSAVHRAPASEQTVPWALDDGRVAASAGRGPAPDGGGVGASYEQAIVGGIDTGPITFVRPAPPAGAGRRASEV